MKTKGEVRAYFETGDKPTQQEFYELINNGVGCIGKLIGADFNSIADQLITLSGGTRFFIQQVLITNASIDMTTATDGEFWSAAGRTGDLMYTTLQGAGDFNTLTVPEKFIESLVGLKIARATSKTIGTSLYFSLGTPQGVAATCDIYIFGIPVA